MEGMAFSKNIPVCYSTTNRFELEFEAEYMSGEEEEDGEEEDEEEDAESSEEEGDEEEEGGA
jgi:hypothetical protein